MSRAGNVSVVAVLTAFATLGAPAPASAAGATTVDISVWVDGHCWRYSWGSGYRVEGYTQSTAAMYTGGGLVTGTVNASANTTGGGADSGNGAVDGVLTTSAVAHAHSSGTPQSFATHSTVGASVRPSSPFPGLPSYVGGSAAFTCSTDSPAGIDVTKSCSMTYTLNASSLRWTRTSGSPGSCTVI